ncbi:molybdate ABC transporter substrate-binding protein [Breoghania sp.]|uniref:molybdate ABC transporter substrate-binding protein n=1 Tax=Breoghania sp. TaxID=2065378 RepID=UPI0029C8369C|nr:molybdate ABC transporter substrate-binding protein [Breoghania sp.]
MLKQTMRQMVAIKLMVVGMMAALLILITAGAGTALAAADTVMVFAAASTTNAVTEIGEIFIKQNPERFVPSFASSSTLAKQIENGAPADVYISANKKWMDYLEQKQMIEPGTRFDLLSNRIVLIVPADSSVGEVVIGPGVDLLPLIGDGRLSMGDPDHVPAGIYGKKAFESLGVWKTIESHVARSKDVRAALALVERGEAPLGQVYATDAAISDKVRVAGVFPESSHPPIVYPVAIVAGKRSPAADRFVKLLQSPEAKAVFEKYGFSVR